MKPDKPGIWEWYNSKGELKLVGVHDVGYFIPLLRVYWWGGYYNVHEDVEGKKRNPNDPHMNAEWPDSWGKYVGELDSVPNDQLYSLPTQEEMIEIFSASGSKQ